jgi:hypothetical protein
LTVEITKAQEDVDGRVEPGQGDLWLYMDHCKQPIFLNRTAVPINREQPATCAASTAARPALRSSGRGFEISPAIQSTLEFSLVRVSLASVTELSGPGELGWDR